MEERPAPGCHLAAVVGGHMLDVDMTAQCAGVRSSESRVAAFAAVTPFPRFFRDRRLRRTYILPIICLIEC
jgi:hypothetical protein